MIYLSQQKCGQFIKAERIAQDTKLPAPYLSKILKQLREGQMVKARRGRKGGVQLNRERPKITFHDICVAMQDPIVNSECVLLKKECNKKSPCAFHAKWSSTKSRLISFLKVTQLVL